MNGRRVSATGVAIAFAIPLVVAASMALLSDRSDEQDLEIALFPPGELAGLDVASEQHAAITADEAIAAAINQIPWSPLTLRDMALGRYGGAAAEAQRGKLVWVMTHVGGGFSPIGPMGRDTSCGWAYRMLLASVVDAETGARLSQSMGGFLDPSWTPAPRGPNQGSRKYCEQLAQGDGSGG